MGLADRGEMSAHGGRLTGLDEWNKAVVDLRDMGEKADYRHQSGAKESNDHDF
jgi:hypothetical protein